MDNLKCPICGEPTNTYMGRSRNDKLCRKHAKDLKEGLITQCPDCGKWHDSKKKCACKLNKEKNQEIKCIICGELSNGKPQCYNCYKETQNHIDSLDKNSSTRKLRDHYYNLKERIIIINSLEETKKQCNRLIAIAMANKNFNDDSSLIDRVYKDVETLISKKRTDKSDIIIKKEQENDAEKGRINTAQDGHNVESDMEVRIDDILYNSFILHSYGKNVSEILEKRKKSDWFIPISNGKGIYIEYWGMNTEKYISDRKEKEELYKKYNVPYIGIEKDDPKQDTQTFTNNLLRELRTKANEYFGFMPEWKK